MKNLIIAITLLHHAGIQRLPPAAGKHSVDTHRRHTILQLSRYGAVAHILPAAVLRYPYGQFHIVGRFSPAIGRSIADPQQIALPHRVLRKARAVTAASQHPRYRSIPIGVQQTPQRFLTDIKPLQQHTLEFFDGNLLAIRVVHFTIGQNPTQIGPQPRVRDFLRRGEFQCSPLLQRIQIGLGQLIALIVVLIGIQRRKHSICIVYPLRKGEIPAAVQLYLPCLLVQHIFPVHGAAITGQ